MNLILIETWNLNMKLKHETETWNWNLKLKLDINTWTWNLILNFEIETWNWNLKSKLEFLELTHLDYQLWFWKECPIFHFLNQPNLGPPFTFFLGRLGKLWDWDHDWKLFLGLVI